MCVNVSTQTSSQIHFQIYSASSECADDHPPGTGKTWKNFVLCPTQLQLQLVSSAHIKSHMAGSDSPFCPTADVVPSRMTQFFTNSLFMFWRVGEMEPYLHWIHWLPVNVLQNFHLRFSGDSESPETYKTKGSTYRVQLGENTTAHNWRAHSVPSVLHNRTRAGCMKRKSFFSSH